jgi:integrase
MKGHLHQRKDKKGKRIEDRWAIVIDLPREAGQRRRKWISFQGTKRQAQIELHRLIAKRETLPIAGNRLTVGQYLDKWVDEQRIGARALQRYKQLVRRNIIPALGHIALSKLTADQISAHYTKALAKGGRLDGRKGGLSPSTVHYQHFILKKALKDAVRRTLLFRNPMDAVDSPHVEKPTMRTLDLDQAAQLIKDARPSSLFIPIFLALTCGLRRGEICALRWGNVDLDKATLNVVESIEQTLAVVRLKRPKSGRGRVIDLPEMVVTELREHKAAQESKLDKPVTPDSFVYTMWNGEFVKPDSLSTMWGQWSAGRKPRVRFHDLRHAHATYLLMQGVHPKVAQERLGHSTVAITMDIYSHVMPGMGAEAAKKVGDALSAAVAKTQIRPTQP